MTVICSFLSNVGIVMAADTAIYDGKPLADISLKTVYSEKLNIAVSAYGIWTHIREKSGKKDAFQMNSHLQEFLRELEEEFKENNINMLQVANKLAEYINAFFEGLSLDDGEIGFHVAGYEKSYSGFLPAVFHVLVKNGKLEAQPDFHENTKFSCSDHSGCETKKMFFDKGLWFELRNGDYEKYAFLVDGLRKLFNELRENGFNYPSTKDLRDVADYVASNVQFVAEVYRQSNVGAYVGGPISVLAFNGNGIQFQFLRVTGDYPVLRNR